MGLLKYGSFSGVTYFSTAKFWVWFSNFENSRFEASILWHVSRDQKWNGNILTFLQKWAKSRRNSVILHCFSIFSKDCQSQNNQTKILSFCINNVMIFMIFFISRLFYFNQWIFFTQIIIFLNSILEVALIFCILTFTVFWGSCTES